MNTQYRLDHIFETGYSFNYDFDFHSFQPDQLRYYLAHEILTKPDEESLRIKLKAIVSYGEDEMVLATNSIAVDFFLSSLPEQTPESIETNQPGLMDSLLQVTVGTLRGVLMKNLKGTPLEPFPLPLIPLSFFRQN